MIQLRIVFSASLFCAVECLARLIHVELLRIYVGTCPEIHNDFNLVPVFILPVANNYGVVFEVGCVDCDLFILHIAEPLGKGDEAVLTLVLCSVFSLPDHEGHRVLGVVVDTPK